MLSILFAMLAQSAQDSPQWIAPWIEQEAAAPHWIWAAGPADTTTSSGTTLAAATFVKEFRTSQACTVRLAFAADNAATASLDGSVVLESRSHSSVESVSLPLGPGQHRVVVQATNGEGTQVNPAGIVGVIDLAYSDGSGERIVTDASWSPTGDGLKAVDLGPSDAPPWSLSSSAFSVPRPCPILRREFSLDRLPEKATVRVVGLGHYELRLNGNDVSPTVIDQAWSVYDKTLFWQEFDVRPYLRRGRNVWAALLGNSFWRVGAPNDSNRFSKTDAMPDFSEGRPYLLWLEATLTYADGGESRLRSDDGWKWTDGPLTFSHIYAGEDWDARKEPDGWDRPGFDDSGWQTAEVVAAPPAKLERLPFNGLTEHERFRPTRTARPAPGVTTYVFSQNSSALLKFTVSGKSGQRIRFKPCEYLDPATDRVKFTYTWGTGKDIWHDYTLRGGDDETHQILFCYEGAQYVEVEGAVPEGDDNPEGLPVVKSLELVHVRADLPTCGAFRCSSGLQNGAFRLIDWSIRSNMSYFPTDCPHREKNAWQEENWHMARAVSYRFDVRDWYRKVARDLRDGQLPDGHVPTNTPNYRVGVPPHGFWNEAAEWGVASVLVPWHLYEWYGDAGSLETSYESMKRYVDYLTSTAKDGVIDSNLGDWYDYGHGLGDGPSRWTPTKLSATGIWALAAKTVAEAARVLDRPDDAKKYDALFSQIRASFVLHFYDPLKKTTVNNGSPQAGSCLALVAGLVPEGDRAEVLQHVIDDLQSRSWQQTTGEVLQVFLVRALAEAGRNDVLHKVYAREERGGYGFMVNQGLTTLPESWDAKPGTGNSMNHFMLGHLIEWHFAYVAGIRQAQGSVGWKRMLIQPNPGPLTSAEAAFDSPSGRVEVKWLVSGGEFHMQVDVPEGATASVTTPDGRSHGQGPGRSIYRAPFPAVQ